MDTKYCLTICLIMVVRCAFMQVAGLQGQVAELHELAVSTQAASAALQEQLTASKAEGQQLTDLLQVRVRNSHASVLPHSTSDRMGCCWCLLGMSKIICTLCVLGSEDMCSVELCLGTLLVGCRAVYRVCKA